MALSQEHGVGRLLYLGRCNRMLMVLYSLHLLTTSRSQDYDDWSL